MYYYIKSLAYAKMLVGVCGLTIFDACRIAGGKYGVNYDWLYRELTE